jgi:hypothetical protein
MEKETHIIKASGEIAVFSEDKLRTSLHRVGATPEQIDSVISEISAKLYEGISTKKIYRLAFNLLKGSSRHLAAKYHLKQAIMELGPSGFPFEKYIAEILRCQGYLTNVCMIVPGQCVKHEVDVIAQMDDQQLMIECKYHNQPGIFCDVKIPLYIQARFKDVESQWKSSKIPGIKIFQGCVVTNTRFSTDAIQYGTCAGLKLIGWDYPAKGSLKEQIDELGLYPITCLTSLTKIEKQHLLDKKIVLCLEIQKDQKILEQLNINASRMDIVMQETHQLCRNLLNKENAQPVQLPKSSLTPPDHVKK